MEKLVFHAESAGRFKLSGTMDFVSVPAALDESVRLFADHKDIQLDFSDVSSADSAGLALLVEWVAWARREECKLRFSNVPEQALALARISDVETMLPVG